MNVRMRVLAIAGAVILSSSLMSGGVVEAKSGNVSILSASSSAKFVIVKVLLDGEEMKFKQQDALLINGATMVPMREIFESLGATIGWDQQTQTVTATKGSTVIFLKIGAKTATVNGKKVQLAKEAAIINKATLVPLRFVSEALGATVSWNSKTSTASIQSSTKVDIPPASNSGTSVSGISVQFGKHDYGSANQKEYDKVMSIVSKAMEGYKSKKYYDSSPQKQAYEDVYYGGVEWDGTVDTPYGRAVYDAQLRAREMSQNGVKLDTVIEVLTLRDLVVGLTGETSSTVQRKGVHSAYDLLVEGDDDCDSFSNVMIAVFDSAGYNTAILANATHADPLVEIGGAWYNLGGGVGKLNGKLPNATSLSTSTTGTYLYTTPTF